MRSPFILWGWLTLSRQPEAQPMPQNYHHISWTGTVNLYRGGCVYPKRAKWFDSPFFRSYPLQQ